MTTGDRQRYLATLNAALELAELAQTGNFQQWCRRAEPMVANSRLEEIRDLLWLMSDAMATRLGSLADERGISFEDALRQERLEGIDRAEADLDE